MAYFKTDLLKMAVELTDSALADAGDKAPIIIDNPDVVANFIQTVYDKLVEINETLD